MNEKVGSVRIGQWYLRGDKGEVFLVTGRDEKSGTIEIQFIDGDLDEIDANYWSALPLEFAEPPEDWTGPIDAELDDSTDAESATTATEESLEPIRIETEAWEDTTAEDERDPLDEGHPTEEPLADHPNAAARVR
jgi:hypothetical protein